MHSEAAVQTSYGHLLEVTDAEPRLRVELCLDCGCRAFPPARHGCLRCGAAPERLSETLESSKADVVASSTVSIAPGGSIPVPSTVAMLQLRAAQEAVFYGLLRDGMLPVGSTVELAAGTTADATPMFVEVVGDD